VVERTTVLSARQTTPSFYGGDVQVFARLALFLPT
jgi:hypothetical protein